MESKSYLYYITLNGFLRCIELKKTINEASILYGAVITEKYLVTGLYIDGILVNPSNHLNLIESGLKPIEPFLFLSSNKLFFLPEDEYRMENIPFFLEFPKPKV